MSHSAEQNRKKAEAMKESMDHHKHSSVIHPRNGMDHEAHKSKDMARDDRDRGEIGASGGVGDMGDGDRYSQGY